MVTTHELRRQVLLLALFLCIPFPAHAASLTSRYASVASYYDHGIHHSSRRRKTNTFATRRRGLMPTSGWSSGSDIAQLVSSTRSTSRKTRQSRTNSHPPPSILDDFPEEYSRDRDVTYRDLSPLGKLIAGTVEVSIATVLEYMTGFIGGYTIGALTDIPRLLFRAADPTQASPLPLLQEISLRTQRMNAKSLGWAKNWAGVSAAFGGFRVAVKVLRNGQEDEWNSVLSSMCAGAFLSRKSGPQAMINGAVMYGMMIYLLSGKALRPKQQFFQYDDLPVE